MGLANLANVPRTAPEFAIFSFSNQDEHFKAAQSILSRKNINLTLYPVDPINFDALGIWLQNHQQMHNDLNGLLGTPGSDLTAIDFRNSAQVEAWTTLHFMEHQRWAQILGTS